MKIQSVLDANGTVAVTEAGSQAESGSGFSKYMDEAQESYSSALDKIFDKASKTYNVSKDLLLAMAKTESNFRATATSKSGAMGIMQLMPGTAAGLGVTDAYDPEQNIMGGAKYISQLIAKYNNNLKYAVAAYNAGSGNVDKYGGIPPFAETQNYVAKVFRYLEEGVSLPQDLSEAKTVESSVKAAAASGASATEVKDSVQTLSEIMEKYFDYDDYLAFLELFTKIIYEKVSGKSLDALAEASESDTEEETAAEAEKLEAIEEEVQEPAKQLTMTVQSGNGMPIVYRQEDDDSSENSDAYKAYLNMTAGGRNNLSILLTKSDS